MGVTLRSERIELRVRPDAKEAIEHAAALLGVSVSNFLVEAAQARASEVIREYEKMYLSVKDSEAFAAALLKSEEPNEALKKALTRYQREVEF